MMKEQKQVYKEVIKENPFFDKMSITFTDRMNFSKTPFGTPQIWAIQTCLGQLRSDRQALPSPRDGRVPEFL